MGPLSFPAASPDRFHFFLSSHLHSFSAAQLSSVAQSCPTLCSPMDCTTPGFPVHHQLPELAETPSIRVFSNESVLCIRWPEYWRSFNFSISPYSEYSGLISFRIDWLDLLAVQGTLKSLLQHHSSKASILRHSAFFIVQLSHPYMTTGRTIALSISATHQIYFILSWARWGLTPLR